MASAGWRFWVFIVTEPIPAENNVSDACPINPVANALQQAGPLASAELAERLVSSGRAATNAACAEVIERAASAGAVSSTSPVRFNKTYLYYLKSHSPKQYADAVKRLLPTKPSFHRVLETVHANKGWITLGQIAKSAAGVPSDSTSKAGGRLALAEVCSQLATLGLVEASPDEGMLFQIGKGFGHPQIGRAAFQRKLEADQRLLDMFKDWARNCFRVAYEANSMRDSPLSATHFNETFWDFCGPLYFGPYSQSAVAQEAGARKRLSLRRDPFLQAVPGGGRSLGRGARQERRISMAAAIDRARGSGPDVL